MPTKKEPLTLGQRVTKLESDMASSKQVLFTIQRAVVAMAAAIADDKAEPGSQLSQRMKAIIKQLP